MLSVLSPHEPYRTYQCPRCKNLELNYGFGFVGFCTTRKKQVVIMPEYGLENPAPDCKEWVRGKTKS